MREVCSVLGVSRSHVTILLHRPAHWADRRKALLNPDDAALLADIQEIVREQPTYGYRRVWAILRHQGIQGRRYSVNHKRMHRMMRDHSWLLFRHGARPVHTRRHGGVVAVQTSNTRWCSHGFELPCDNGERVRVAFALDSCDRKAMSWVATTKGIDSNLVGDLMMQVVEYRFGTVSGLLHMPLTIEEAIVSSYRGSKKPGQVTICRPGSSGTGKTS